MKKIVSVIFSVMLLCSVFLTASAEDHPPRLVDDANLLTTNEEMELWGLLDDISERQQFDVVVVTVDSLEGKSPMEFADDYYDYNGYGYGIDRDGVLLLVSMEYRDYWISTTGYGITAITDAGIDYMEEKFVHYMSDGDYAKSFTVFAQLCDDFVTEAKSGTPYDIGNMPKEPFNIFFSLFLALIIGFSIAFIIVLVMKSQLKTVRYQSAASSYVKQGSVKINEKRDNFLYRNVTKREKPRDNGSSGGGGSSTHTSSSGSSHGGGGGKF